MIALLLPPAKLHVEANRLVENGQTVLLRGADIGGGNDQSAFRSCRVALEDMGANCVRFAVNEDAWLGKSGGKKSNRDDYRDSIDDIGNYVVHRHGYLILVVTTDLHTPLSSSSRLYLKSLFGLFERSDHVLFEVEGAGQTDIGTVRSFHFRNVLVFPSSAGQRFDDPQGDGALAYVPADPKSAPSSADPIWIGGNLWPGTALSLVADWTYTLTGWGRTVQQLLGAR